MPEPSTDLGGGDSICRATFNHQDKKGGGDPGFLRSAAGLDVRLHREAVDGLALQNTLYRLLGIAHAAEAGA
ncbi:MAG: hypothetical protein ACOVKO_02110, partial [Elstera sp.]